MNENPHPEEPNSGNEADVESEAEEECLWEFELSTATQRTQP